ncbi:hypothetical protein Psesu_2727 [Pseudoxanthomonas suwonensis 11-1]|uniref:Uncharacterized protein n=1 Tax=Pseudoxanthomonas suwonensis (strain 11-1) TaxID=743721 RepID=E6WWK5_PSEUU|nr:hypothetical protein [Pseudoxanthomonas suwonensis]ADV28554.1 hypothetical protein Psesu_2727 [Pseudoxanthomonas suwonensis 11-1]
MKRSGYLAILMVLGGFLYAWHHRASIVHIAQIAAETDAQLSQECE